MLIQNFSFDLSYIDFNCLPMPTSSTLHFLISRSFSISCIQRSSVCTSIDGACCEAGSDSKYGLPRRLSTSTRITRTWFSVVSDTKFSLEQPSAFLVASARVYQRKIHGSEIQEFRKLFHYGINLETMRLSIRNTLTRNVLSLRNSFLRLALCPKDSICNCCNCSVWMHILWLF